MIHTKGGVGKTSTAQNLSSALGLKGFRVLIVDLDRQMSLTLNTGFSAGSDLLPRILAGQLAEPLPTRSPNVDIITGNGDLWRLIDKLTPEISGTRLKAYVDSINSRYDYMLLDGPPSWGAPNEVMLFVTDEIIIPCKPTESNVRAIQPTLNDVDEWIIRHPRKKISIRRVLWTQIRRRNELHEHLIKQVQKSNIPVFETVIRHSAIIEKSESFKENIFTYSPRSTGALDYMLLAEEWLSNGK